jgi:hypothetical protein
MTSVPDPQIMLSCWQDTPLSRPTMKQLHEDLRQFGEDEMEAQYEKYRSEKHVWGVNAMITFCDFGHFSVKKLAVFMKSNVSTILLAHIRKLLFCVKIDLGWRTYC